MIRVIKTKSIAAEGAGRRDYATDVTITTVPVVRRHQFRATVSVIEEGTAAGKTWNGAFGYIGGNLGIHHQWHNFVFDIQPAILIKAGIGIFNYAKYLETGDIHSAMTDGPYYMQYAYGRAEWNLKAGYHVTPSDPYDFIGVIFYPYVDGDFEARVSLNAYGIMEEYP